MTSTTLCPMCRRRGSPDGLLCQGGADSCTEMLAAALRGVPSLEQAAVVTYRRGARIGLGGGRSDTLQLPFDPRVPPAVRDLDRSINALAWPAAGQSMAGRATFLADHTSSVLRTRVELVQLFRNLLLNVKALERIVDRPAELDYAGQCNHIVRPAVVPTQAEPDVKPRPPVVCMADLYAETKVPFVKCPKCGTTHDVKARRKVMLRQVGGTLVTAAEAAAALNWTDDPVTPERVRKWAERGFLPVRGRNQRGHAMYRLDEIREQLHRSARRNAARRPQQPPAPTGKRARRLANTTTDSRGT